MLNYQRVFYIVYVQMYTVCICMLKCICHMSMYRSPPVDVVRGGGGGVTPHTIWRGVNTRHGSI